MSEQALPASRPPTMREIFAWYEQCETRELNPDAERTRKGIRDRFCAHRDGDGVPWGDKTYNALKTYHLVAFIKSWSSLKSNNSRRRVASSIRAAMNAAARMGFIDYSPFVSPRLPMGGRGRDLTDREFQAILRHSRQASFRRLVLFMRLTGARPGEACQVQWSMVNAAARLLILKDHKTARITGEPRKIRLSAVAMRLLLWIRAHQDAASQYIFTNSFGRPWLRKSFSKHFRMVRARARLSKEVKPHSLRHTFATRALMNGVDLLTVSTLLSHKNTSMTERYVHMIDKSQHLELAVEKAVGGHPGSLRVLPLLEEPAPIFAEPKPAKRQIPARRDCQGKLKRKPICPAEQRCYDAVRDAIAEKPDLAGMNDEELFRELKKQPTCAALLPDSTWTFHLYMNHARRAIGTPDDPAVLRRRAPEDATPAQAKYRTAAAKKHLARRRAFAEGLARAISLRPELSRLSHLALFAALATDPTCAEWLPKSRRAFGRFLKHASALAAQDAELAQRGGAA